MKRKNFPLFQILNSQTGYQSWWSLLWRLWVSWDHQGGSRDPLGMAAKLTDEGPHSVISLTFSWCKNAPVASEVTWTQMQTRNLWVVNSLMFKGNNTAFPPTRFPMEGYSRSTPVFLPYTTFFPIAVEQFVWLVCDSCFSVLKWMEFFCRRD